MVESRWRHRAPAVRMLAVLLVCVAWASAASAQDRLVRRFARGDGLAVPPVWALAQDSVGFLWIGAHGGLFRYDGVAFRHWASDRIDGIVRAVAVAPDGRIAARTEAGALYRVTAGGADRMTDPPGGASAEYPTLDIDAGGRLWTVVAGGEAAYRRVEGDGGWRTLPTERFDGRPVHGIVAGDAGGVYILTDSAVWHVEAPEAVPRERFAAPVNDVHPMPDGRVLLLTRDGRIVELGADDDEGGTETRVLASRAAGDIPPARPIAITERNGEVWAAFDRYLVSLRPGRPPEVIAPSDGFEAGGPLLVDREGSLWLGSFAALFQYPEPATTLWNDRHGLPSRHTRYLARVGDRLWVTTWQGAGLIRGAERDAVRAESTGIDARSRPCVDATGAVWLATSDGPVRVRGDRVVGRAPSPEAFNACSHAPGPGLWIGSGRGLYYADADLGTLRRVDGTPFGDEDRITALLQDRRGEIWAGGDERICRASAAAVLAGANDGARWSCDAVPGSGDVVALLELSDGALWAATRRQAVLTYDAERGWRPLAGNDRLASRDVFALEPSASGGVWIVGHGILRRVSPRADGWEVLERLGGWHGLLAVGGADLIEDDDGTLWIATSLGLLRISPRARFASLDPPGVALVDARVDAEPVPLGPGLELPSDRNRLELRFAALSYRDPGAIRYQVRLGPASPWVDTRGAASFRWVDLPAGRYDAEVRASLDGRRWSAEPARFTFDVLPPWYRTGWALGLFTALAAGLLWAAYRARVAFLLGLERQRTRIAIDLHDELGSGLGSVGILAELLARRRLDDGDRRRFAHEIARTAEQLGSALSDIVWSLDPRTATLEALAARLAGHGERLFAGDEVDFLVRAPTAWPPTRLPLPLRRNVLMIGLEALHNAARHARARRVTLTFARRRGEWTLSVADDGVGLGHGTVDGTPGDDADRHGRGLRGMRRRAAEIGATLEWSSAEAGPGRGTIVTLRFRLARSRRGRVRAWLERLRRRGWSWPAVRSHRRRRSRRRRRRDPSGLGRRPPVSEE